MIPRQPPRQTGSGYLYLPPYRVQGTSIAGEESFVQIPELDVCFDVGRAARLMLTSNFVALTHGHMDHAAGIAYYFSQRMFQGMGCGTLLCHRKLVEPIKRMMQGWVDIEDQQTAHQVLAMEPGKPSEEFEIKNHIFLRAFETNHTSSSLGFVVVEKRNKLKDEYAGLPQDKLVDLKKSGEEITYLREVPLVVYTGDTAYGSFFEREDIVNAKILITECTFLEDDHRDRARVGNHMHITDIARVLETSRAEHVVLTHLSRRTHLGQAREQLHKIIPAEQHDRIHLLMDHRTNRARYETQLADVLRVE